MQLFRSTENRTSNRLRMFCVSVTPLRLHSVANLEQHTDRMMATFGKTSLYCASCSLEYWNLVVAEQQFLNLHGERGARLSRDQSIYEPTKQTIFFKFLSPFLLFAPSAYLKKLQNTSVDSLVNQPSWANIKKQLTEEWSQSALFVSSFYIHWCVGTFSWLWRQGHCSTEC